jgi:hypothetical protein
VMILLINISSNNDFDPHYLNCYLKKKSFVWLNFFQFHPLIFNLLGIAQHGFSRLSVSGLKTRVTGLKS